VGQVTTRTETYPAPPPTGPAVSAPRVRGSAAGPAAELFVRPRKAEDAR
jgi:hypothetical protein